MIRIAAVADPHYGVDSAGQLGPQLQRVGDCADVLLLGGDLTRVGARDEAAVLAGELAEVPVPVAAVLGNHDFHSDEPDAVRKELEDAGVHVLEGEALELSVDGSTLGVAGTKGFGGGFAGACGTDFGEPEMKRFIRHTESMAERLHDTLTDLHTDVRVALLHYAPIKDTLTGERLEIFPFLGSYLLAQAIDDAGADLVVHGHAHGGVEKGVTPGGVHVRNVAYPVIRSSYNIYTVASGSVREAPHRC